MTAIALDINALAQELEESGVDLTVASSGGGEGYVPPAEGATRLRFVSYIETGIHSTEFQGAKKTKPRAEFTFELSGPKHEPKALDDGRQIPHRITFKETVGTHEKNGYMKLFKIMANGGTAKNFVSLLGKAFRGTVSHYKFKGADGKDRAIAQLKSNGSYAISSPSYEDPETGELRTVKVADAITPLKVFLWNHANPEQLLAMWDSIFIDGTYDDGGSKNKLQETIKKAENFKGSPIFNALVEAGREEETVPAAKAKPAEEKEEKDETPPLIAQAEPRRTAAKAAAKKAPPKAEPEPEPQQDNDDPLAGL